MVIENYCHNFTIFTVKFHITAQKGSNFWSEFKIMDKIISTIRWPKDNLYTYVCRYIFCIPRHALFAFMKITCKVSHGRSCQIFQISVTNVNNLIICNIFFLLLFPGILALYYGFFSSTIERIRTSHIALIIGCQSSGRAADSHGWQNDVSHKFVLNYYSFFCFFLVCKFFTTSSLSIN